MGIADGAVVKVLDSRMVDCGLSPGTGSLKIARVHVPVCPESQEHSRGEGDSVAVPQRVASRLPSFFPTSVHTLWQNLKINE